MAKHVITKLLDDIDGGDADETVTFSIDGYQYTIDLSAKNATKLREAMGPYLSAGTRQGKYAVSAPATGRSSYPARSAATTADKERNNQIRVWAGKNGYELSQRGRIPQHIIEAFESNTPHPDKAAADQAKALEQEMAASAPKRTARKPAKAVAAASS